ncbi:MAG: DNA polymerase sliding clamp [Candidatus Nitrosocaldus sp.]
MLIARSRSAEEWKTVVSAISTIVEEATFEATSEGISFRGMDPSHVALIDVQLLNSAFEHYICDGSIRFAVRVDEFLKLLKRAGKDDSIEISIGKVGRVEGKEGIGEGIEEGEAASAREREEAVALTAAEENMLTIKMVSKYTREYKMRLIESTSSSTPLPKISFNTRVMMKMGSFIEALKDVEIVSDYITIKCNDSILQFTGKGDTGGAIITFKQGDEGIEEMNSKGESSATYSLEYLGGIVKAVDNAESVVIEYSTRMPLRLEFKMPYMCKIYFYLAPRVES